MAEFFDVSRQVHLVDGKYFDKNLGDIVDARLGLLAETFKEYVKRPQYTEVAQFFTLVRQGLITAQHIFEGLNRPLYSDGSPKGDGDKLIYAWKPAYDALWKGDSFSGAAIEVEAPRRKVFVVIIGPNDKAEEKYADIEGWIRKWNWVHEDLLLSGAPIDWLERYDRKLWSA